MTHYYSKTHTFEHPWTLATFSIFKKYPHKHARHVLSVDYTNVETIAAEGDKYSILKVERVLNCCFSFPLLSHILPKHTFPVKETLFIDADRKVAEMRTEYTWGKFFSFSELCCYSQSLQHKVATNFLAKSSVSVSWGSSLFPNLERTVAEHGLKQNRVGVRIVNSLCEKLRDGFPRFK